MTDFFSRLLHIFRPQSHPLSTARRVASVGRLLAAFLALSTWVLSGQGVYAQGFVSQDEVAPIVENQSGAVDEVPEVFYDYYVMGENQSNTVLARHDLYHTLGEGDVEWGRHRARVVELINRTTLAQVQVGDTLVVPSHFEVDFRAFSPFPWYYPGGRDFDKLLILDKDVQAWAAYEWGRLVRWGVNNTGAEESPTPSGRFNINWKEEYRVSSLSPPDEPWEMYWVMNIHDARGIHLHQYPMPTGGPTSYGCVRLVDSDARWLYEWTDAWTTTVPGDGVETRQGRLLEQGTTVLVLGENPEGHPSPFAFKEHYPVLERVALPEHPYDVPPGTPQQERFDRGLTGR